MKSFSSFTKLSSYLSVSCYIILLTLFSYKRRHMVHVSQKVLWSCVSLPGGTGREFQGVLRWSRTVVRAVWALFLVRRACSYVTRPRPEQNRSCCAFARKQANFLLYFAHSHLTFPSCIVVQQPRTSDDGECWYVVSCSEGAH
jgi:hypothetical protein